MKKKKVFILLPDGVGLRNFAYSKFYSLGKEKYNILFWNNTPFDLKEINLSELRMKTPILHPLTDLIKSVVIQASLTENIKREKDSVYNLYRFKPNNKGLKNKIKNTLISILLLLFSNKSGIAFLKKWMYKLESSTQFYEVCKKDLELEKPDFVFCTNQRPVVAIAPLLAAKSLRIPTATFVFSWDNLPKATMIVQTDYYFVWSLHMKNELLKYYPEIKLDQIKVTGTPQFEPHFDESIFCDKALFFKENNLDLNNKYICYSGDDITTCPDDEKYLEDVAEAIQDLNLEGHNLGIIFRRCPVDFSDRYDQVLNKYSDIIFSINPDWQNIGNFWNAILPTPNDNKLLINTIRYSEMVINLGSSMVFDFSIFNKPCLYINYDVHNKLIPNWSVSKIYQFIHFRSMPHRECVTWINSKSEIKAKIEKSLNSKQEIESKKWLEIISENPLNNASQRIWDSIDSII